MAVHRQLLRKFASLELEASELKKKTMLRDERIRQLESNSKSLVGNIRQQAERHVAELANVKDSIQVCVCVHIHVPNDIFIHVEHIYIYIYIQLHIHIYTP
ncbi:hypothetical protein EON63_25365 [archaeon]|nr:MAG: hypothetical protein EON63_25365 [archaeon]